jgi:aryl-alcohol dehydrogenase-like predicted oxidoreductase
MRKLNRREFIGSAVAITGACATDAAFVESRAMPDAKVWTEPAFAFDLSIKSSTDVVRLGKSGLKVSVVGIGTGSIGYAHQSRQTRLGQDAFTRLMRHALDQGINFFDLADSYGSHSFFREAMKGVPREKYVVQTKTDNRDAPQARADIDRFLSELGTDHIDSLIIHCVTEADWTTRFRGVMDVFAEAKQKGKIRSCGVTCHSFEALKAAEASDWVQVNQVRWNPRGAHMDAGGEEARALFRKMRTKGQGMIGMKVVGQGDIIGGNRKSLSPEDCFRFQIESGVVDAFVVGVESTGHIDQLLRGTQMALNDFGYRRIDYA